MRRELDVVHARATFDVESRQLCNVGRRCRGVDVVVDEKPASARQVCMRYNDCDGRAKVTDMTDALDAVTEELERVRDGGANDGRPQVPDM